MHRAYTDAKLITEQLGSGDEYEKINQVISIVITNETLIKDNSLYHHRFTFYDSDAKIEFSDIIEIHTLELSKLPEGVDGTLLYDWAKFIDAETEEELNMVAERNPEVQKAVVRLEVLSGDERARYIAEMEEKAWRDMQSHKKDARREGREKWQSVVAEKETMLAGKDAEIADNRAEIARLRAELEAARNR